MAPLWRARRFSRRRGSNSNSPKMNNSAELSTPSKRRLYWSTSRKRFEIQKKYYSRTPVKEIGGFKTAVSVSKISPPGDVFNRGEVRGNFPIRVRHDRKTRIFALFFVNFDVRRTSAEKKMGKMTEIMKTRFFKNSARWRIHLSSVVASYGRPLY